MVVTLSNMRTRLRRRLEDTDANNPHWSDEEIDQYLNESLQDLFDNVYMIDRFALPVSQLDYTWPASQLEIDLVQLLGTRDFDILIIEAYSDPENTFDSSNTANYPVPLVRENPEELYRRLASSVQTARHYETPNLTWGTGAGMYRYAMFSIDQGGTVKINMRMAPVPTTAIKLRFSFLKPFKPLALATDVILDNQFFRFIDLVEYGAVLKAKGRSDEATDPVMQAYVNRLAMLRSWLDARARTGAPRVVVDGY